MSEIKTNKISPRKGTTQTIGDSGDTISIPCGVTVTNAGTITTAGISGGTINNSGGTISGLAGVIEWDTTAKTTAFTAESNKGYFCNTTSAAFTVTLPASPTAGDVIGLKDYANTFDTNNLTIDPNGNNIQGSANNFIISVEGTSAQFIYVDATRGWVLIDASKASDIEEGPAYIVATGGTITTCGNDKIHTFTGPGTFTVCSVGNPAGSVAVDYLVVAGGGSGGESGPTTGAAGGGGAGGYRTSFPTCGGSLPVSVTAYPITVGGGGTAPRGSGSNSIFSTITSAGGGGGGLGGAPTSGVPGGSGGGGRNQCAGNVFGNGNTPPVSPPQGNNGGQGSTVGAQASGGGGGGASTVGGNASPTVSGNGGTGSTNSISGSSLSYAGGGGGKAECGSGSAGSSPCGTGGAGASGTGIGTAGATNRGGGGGPASAGGSGIVIIRYKYQ